MKNNTNVGPLTCVLLSVAIVMLIMRYGKSFYSPIEIQPLNEESIFNTPYEMKCVPGPGPEASPYTVNLTPGGMCGIQKRVDQQASYKIKNGIGGSLLD